MLHLPFLACCSRNGACRDALTCICHCLNRRWRAAGSTCRAWGRCCARVATSACSCSTRWGRAGRRTARRCAAAAAHAYAVGPAANHGAAQPLPTDRLRAPGSMHAVRGLHAPHAVGSGAFKSGGMAGKQGESRTLLPAQTAACSRMVEEGLLAAGSAAEALRRTCAQSRRPTRPLWAPAAASSAPCRPPPPLCRCAAQ